MIFAQIEANIVVNTIVASPIDIFDPSYIYIDVTNITCADGSPVQIGCSYDGTTFNSPITGN